MHNLQNIKHIKQTTHYFKQHMIIELMNNHVNAPSTAGLGYDFVNFFTLGFLLDHVYLSFSNLKLVIEFIGAKYVVLQHAF